LSSGHPVLSGAGFGLRSAAGGRTSRRALLRAAVGAAGVAAAGTYLVACGPAAGGGAGGSQAGASSAGLTPAQANPIQILWRPWYNFNQATSKTGHDLLMQGIQPWLQKNPGVQVTITYMGYQQTTVTALLAGSGPDIFADWVLPLFTSGNLLLDLSKYVKQDNVDLSIFPKLEMQLFQQGGGLWALPSYLHLEAPCVNLTVLDNLGLSYPEPGWTWQDWTRLWERVTNKSTDPKQRRVGGVFYWSGYDYHGGNPHAYYLKGFGGEYVDPADPTKCYLNSPGSKQCLEWCYNLLREGACGTSALSFTTGQQVTQQMDTAGGLIGAAQSWNGIKWQIYDEAIWPAGKVAYAASDFYAISAATKRPDVVWDFMKYLCVQTDWQIWMAKLSLNGPNQKGLYEQWVQILKSVAPPLQKIDLDVFRRQMENDEPYFGLTFKYAEAQAAAAINSNTAPAQQGTVSVDIAVQKATEQVNAIEAAGAAQIAATQANKARFPTQGPELVNVPTGI
jgi:ABC-type glycerol-3-phosphate transport system substrate-binding protein